MKKSLTLVMVTVLSSGAMAQKHSTGQPVTSLQAAQKAADDTPVAIEGHFVKQLEKHKFLFRDLSGQEMVVEVDRSAWTGQTIVPTDKIRIQGEVDRELPSLTEIEVDVITKL